jgi:SagB-type dehydrogenase family enzyme
MTSDAEVVDLPLPGRGELSVEEAIERRRSVREYQEGSVTLAEVAALAWACQGVTSPQGLRAAPSAGGTYPLTLYVVAGMVEGLEPGVYRYVPERHSLAIVRQGDLRAELAGTALDQEWVKEAPLNLVLAADYSRTTGVYGERGVRYVHIEVGHAAQNVYLQAVALGLGTVAVGAFDDEAVTRLLGLPSGEEALYIMPVGRDAG